MSLLYVFAYIRIYEHSISASTSDAPELASHIAKVLYINKICACAYIPNNEYVPG